MCSEYCFECQEPCWQVNIFFGNDPDKLVSRADISDLNTMSTSVLLTEKDVRHSVEETKNKPAGLSCPAGPPCYTPMFVLANKSCSKACNIQPAGSRQDQHEKQARRETDMVTLPGEMPGADHKKPWYAVSD